ncbi:MAG: response regulator [Pseudomonadota bacterium]
MAKRILIADDSLTIQKAFAMTFGGEDATLLAARSADEGLTIARQSRPDLVIADAVMPGRSGYDLCAAIKSDPALRGVPVYILASTQNPYDDARGRQCAADGQFIKPFEPVSLVERVKEAIAKGASSATLVPVAAAQSGRPSLAAVASPPGMPGMPSRPTAPPLRSLPPAEPEDDYGEISIDALSSREAPNSGTRSGSSPASPPLEATPPPVTPPARSPAAPINPPGTLRPSLIPGLRPGAVTGARPVPMRPASMPGAPGHGPAVSPPGVAHTPSVSPLAAQAPAARSPATPATPVAPGPARTLMGLPAAVAHPPARFGAPSAPARPATQPVHPLDTRTPPPVSHGPAASGGVPVPAASAPKIERRSEQKNDRSVDQVMAAISAKGPEYEAIAKLSREIIERIVWEIVPELAEVIVREELQKRGRI